MRSYSLIDTLFIFPSGRRLADGQSYLRARPALQETAMEQHSPEWGGWCVQFHSGHDAQAGDEHRRIVCIGRPSLRRSIVHTELPVAQWVYESTSEGLAQNGATISQALSGMYAIIEITADRICILTDRMGFRPVYISMDEQQRVNGIGTQLESLAIATRQQTAFDDVSLAELLVHNFISFPYTTRIGIQELDPCSVSTIDPRSGSIETRVLWEPTEPEIFASFDATREQLRSAIQNAADDITHGCSNAAVLLSGGFDSRLVIAAMPKDRLGAALTYVTNPNRETDVARAVADAAGVEHVLVQRSASYFPELVQHGMELLGMELRGNTHGLCIAENGLTQRFDVIIGGQLSDTLLKDHFMGFDKRDALRPKSVLSRIKSMLKGPAAPRKISAEHTTGRGQLEKHLSPEIREKLRLRKATRLEEVRRVRPTSADEWHRFWPCSRQDDSSHTLGNTRITISDTLFAHTDIVEVARCLSDKMRVGGTLADGVYMEICGKLASITNANTGLPANASARAVFANKRRMRLERQQAVENEGERRDWNAVENSWADPIAMQKHSPFWESSRVRLSESGAVGILDRIMDRSGKDMIASYQDDLPSTTNHIAMQMMLWADDLLCTQDCAEVGERS